MERLQIAVEKARAKRRDRLQEEAEAPKAPPSPQKIAPIAIEIAPAAPVMVKGAASISEAWQALRPLETSIKAIRKNRLISFEGGPVAGPYDLLRTKMIQQARANGWRRVAIVSPHAACGKTTTAANLAFSFARQKDLRTLFLDLDLRRPALGKIMGRAPKFNMADVLERRITFAEHGERYGDNVGFGFNNNAVRNSSEILQSHQTQEVLNEIEETYGTDLMIFDMPPMLVSDDNFGFLKNVDCALVLVAAEKTPIHQIDVTERQVAELTNVMGIVLNKCNYSDGTYGYDMGQY